MAELADEALMLAKEQLAAVLPRRWRHVQAVGLKATRVGALLFEPADDAVLVAAAWLHDVGYSPTIVDTGFHPLDGARWLRERGFNERVTSLVAHHSCAWLEADERGLSVELDREFVREETMVADALWYADMTTGPDGEDMTVGDRLAEATSRYGPNDIVSRFLVRAEPAIVAAVERTDELLREASAR
jgi:HD domain